MSQNVYAHSGADSRAFGSLLDRNAVLRRSLSELELDTCCPLSLLRFAAPVATCSALTQLTLEWWRHEGQAPVRADILAQLAALPLLEKLSLSGCNEPAFTGERGSLAVWPTLPNAPRLTSLKLSGTTNFVSIGTDAALGRLQALYLVQWAGEDVET